MAGNQRCQAIPTQLDVLQFEEFVLPHLSVGRRGPAPKLSLHTIFNYVLRLLYLGCQWKKLPIEKDGKGRPEIHYMRIYCIWRRWNLRARKLPKRGRKPFFKKSIFDERFRTIERVFAWEDKFRRLLLRFERLSQVHYAFKSLAYTLINLRHYCST
ncbi:MAG: hypothetical protein PHY54_16595 [Methylococcales bacterium]|nr:hypothetical protein [Methylococcales bacterium]